MTAETTDDAEQKLHALVVLTGHRPNVSISAVYLKACRAWRWSFSTGQMRTAHDALDVFNAGDLALAIATAAALPPAPRFM